MALLHEGLVGKTVTDVISPGEYKEWPDQLVITFDDGTRLVIDVGGEFEKIGLIRPDALA